MKHALWGCLLLAGLAQAASQPWTITLQAPSLPAGQHYALRGSAAPLSWQRGLAVLPGKPLTLAWEGQPLEAKFVVEDDRGEALRWERGNNRRWAAAPTGPLTFDRNEETEALWRAVLAADTALFAAFNAGDAAGSEPYFSDRLEFFHDSGGLAGKAQTMKQFRENAARTQVRVRRELLPEGLAIYPVPGVGAMQIGQHRFCSRERQANGEFAPEQCSVYGFSHVWEQTADGRWQLLRVLSYGH